eukprot:TRINITY_DN1493_c0_g2_i1.p1 TRINITY_DN1493_c0_g2~~TRINITY_DN1493_c0_g2_i1.p1  ORF type:complete len:375 (+),score=52.66 TRINITY_DN1493_c0_g2_i1:55-1179(+)
MHAAVTIAVAAVCFTVSAGRAVVMFYPELFKPTWDAIPWDVIGAVLLIITGAVSCGENRWFFGSVSMFLGCAASVGASLLKNDARRNLLFGGVCCVLGATLQTSRPVCLVALAALLPQLRVHETQLPVYVVFFIVSNYLTNLYLNYVLTNIAFRMAIVCIVVSPYAPMCEPFGLLSLAVGVVAWAASWEAHGMEADALLFLGTALYGYGTVVARGKGGKQEYFPMGAEDEQCDLETVQVEPNVEEDGANPPNPATEGLLLSMSPEDETHTSPVADLVYYIFTTAKPGLTAEEIGLEDESHRVATQPEWVAFCEKELEEYDGSSLLSATPSAVDGICVKLGLQPEVVRAGHAQKHHKKIKKKKKQHQHELENLWP